MTTPYDVALRIRQRQIDEMRIAIGAEAAELAAVEASRNEVEAALSRERAIAAADPLLASHGYGSRMLTRRHQLRQNHSRIDRRLAELREEAAAAYGSFRAVELAAEDFKAEAERGLANAEQSRIDDFAGAAFIRQARPVRADKPGGDGQA